MLKLNKVMTHAFFVMLIALTCSCDGKPTDKAQTGLKMISIKSGQVELKVELAISDTEKNIGLMHRKGLKDGDGMLFVNKSDQKLVFWMKNTFIPLSLAYISADGMVKEIYDMTPLSLEGVPSVHHVRYALEVPQGWFEKVGIKVGDSFDIPKKF